MVFGKTREFLSKKKKEISEDMEFRKGLKEVARAKEKKVFRENLEKESFAMAEKKGKERAKMVASGGSSAAVTIGQTLGGVKKGFTDSLGAIKQVTGTPNRRKTKRRKGKKGKKRRTQRSKGRDPFGFDDFGGEDFGLF